MATSPLDRFRLDGKTVAITGASSGFGHHFAGVLAAAGARVVLGARRTEKIDARVAELDKRKMFRGVKKEDFENAKSTFKTMKTTWAEAVENAKAGKTVTAATKGKSAKEMGDQLCETLDIKKT